MEWWATAFDELYLRLFETMLGPERTEREVMGSRVMLGLRPGDRILDLCCGQGRHAVPLARAGYRVAGLDHSAYLLDQARQRAAQVGAGVQWVQGDMRCLPWGERFDACLNLFTAFGYFDDEEDNQQVLHEVCRILKPGGKLLLDLSNRDYYLLRWLPRSWQRREGALVLEETDFDPLICRFTVTFTWIEGNHRQSISHSVRYYTAPEIEAMLWAAGLVPQAIYGDFDQTEFDIFSPRMIVVAQKPQNSLANGRAGGW